MLTLTLTAVRFIARIRQLTSFTIRDSPSFEHSIRVNVAFAPWRENRHQLSNF
jgi:hypothetical protein